MATKHWLIIAFITLISPLIYGYYFGFLDHHHYLPYLNKLIDPTIYSSDYYFSQPHNLYSPFNYVTVFITKLTLLSLPWTHLIIYLFSLFLLYFSIYKLSFKLYKNISISLLAISYIILPKWAAQIGYLTHHFYFVSRDLSLGLSLLALVSILKNQRIYSGILIFLAALVNPSIPIPIAMLWLVQFIKLKTAPVFIPPINQSWLTTLKHRGTYSFPLLWKWTGWGNFFLFFSLLFTSFLALNKKLFGQHFKTIKNLIIICLSLFVFHILISSIIPIPFLIQLQLLRAVNFVFYLALISFAASIASLLKDKKVIARLLAIIAAMAVFLWGDHLTVWHFMAILPLPAYLVLTKTNTNLKAPQNLTKFILVFLLIFCAYRVFIIKPQLKLPFFVHYQNALIDLINYDDWLSLQLWVNQHTPKQAVFLTPPHLSGFRSFSKRSIIGDYKDGGLTFYSSDYSDAWQYRVKTLENYSQFNSDDFESVSNKFNFDYLVVTNQHQPLEFDLVYQNQSYKLYKI